MNDVQTSPGHLVMTKNPEMREKICSLEASIRAFLETHQIQQPECPLQHTFAPGAYARTIFIPKETLVVGKIHKHAHLNMLMQGKVSVATEDGPMVYQAPMVMVSKAGTKRVVFTHEDTIWTTVHLTDKTDLEAIEADIIAPSYENFDMLQDAEVQQLLPLCVAKEDV